MALGLISAVPRQFLERPAHQGERLFRDALVSVERASAICDYILRAFLAANGLIGRISSYLTGLHGICEEPPCLEALLGTRRRKLYLAMPGKRVSDERRALLLRAFEVIIRMHWTRSAWDLS